MQFIWISLVAIAIAMTPIAVAIIGSGRASDCGSANSESEPTPITPITVPTVVTVMAAIVRVMMTAVATPRVSLCRRHKRRHG